jgi:hypothetical protein
MKIRRDDHKRRDAPGGFRAGSRPDGERAPSRRADEYDTVSEHGAHRDRFRDIVHPGPHGRFSHRGTVSTMPG